MQVITILFGEFIGQCLCLPPPHRRPSPDRRQSRACASTVCRDRMDPLLTKWQRWETLKQTLLQDRPQ